MIPIKSRRGFLFTIATIILILPLIYLVSFYGGVSETQLDDTLGRIRCDELHYYVEDVRRDMGRAVQIFGRRAAIYAVDAAINSTNGLGDYEFNCTSHCGVDCSEFSFEVNGSEAAIAELILCGTLYGRNATYMVNHTLPIWIEKMIEEGERMNFEVEISAKEIHIIPMDAWHFAVMIDNKVRIRDKKGLCYYTENIVSVHSNSSIIGLYDPQYALHVEAEGDRLKPIENCTSALGGLINLVDSDDATGGGIISGLTLVYGEDPVKTPGDLIDYCDNTPQEILGQQILVLQGAVGIAGNPNVWEACFNATNSKHLGALIDYQGPQTCEDMDDYADSIPYSCDAGTSLLNIDSDVCVMMINNDTCVPPIHAVVEGLASDSVDTSCYYISDVSGKYDVSCGFDMSNGASFFDRLDGNLTLSEKYVNQSEQYFGNSLIGIESFVDLNLLSKLKDLGYDVKVNYSSTWVDYLYWQDEPGCGVMAYCGEEEERFKLDCAHSHEYRFDTDCSAITGCPRCPVNVELKHCMIGSGPYDITFTLKVNDSADVPMDLSEEPPIDITGDLIASGFMEKMAGETGIYVYTESGVAGDTKIGGNITIMEAICPLVSDDVPDNKKASALDPC